jgi:methionine aminopeptidase
MRGEHAEAIVASTLLPRPSGDIANVDSWTVVTGDGSLFAQFEPTVVVTREGVEVVT